MRFYKVAGTPVFTYCKIVTSHCHTLYLDPNQSLTDRNWLSAL